MGLKRVMVIHSRNILSFLTKSTTFLRFLTLKRKNRLKCTKVKLVLLLTLKRANEVKMTNGEIFDKLLFFFDQKYHFLEILDIKTQKGD